MNKDKFRGLKKVVMVNVLEGNGQDIPFREVHYIFDLEQHGGTFGGFVGKIDPMDSGNMPADSAKEPA